MAGSSDPQVVSLLHGDGLQELKQLQNLLHLFYHRNKNQHRCSVWWRSFDKFRRECKFLLIDAEKWRAASLELSNGTWPKGVKGVKIRMAVAQKNATRKPELESKIQRRLSWWQHGLIEKWWIAFTHVLALNQFAQLGLFLIATLARFSRLTGLTAALKQAADAETEALITRFATQEIHNLLGVTERLDGEDMGEIVQRNGHRSPDRGRDLTASPSNLGNKASLRPHGYPTNEALFQEDQTPALSSQQRKYTVPATPAASKKKRPKTDNAIDDLFSGLL
ncbi:MAG: hypothetical protein Q9165_004643 [Trypethelium subeluteriae]